MPTNGNGAAFSLLRKATSRVESEVDDGTATSADFTLYVSNVPPHLGATHDSHDAAVRQYRAFFARLCATPPRSRSRRDTRRWWLLGADVEASGDPPEVPADAEISEIVIVKNNGEWLKQRALYKKAVENAEYAKLKERQPAKKKKKKKQKASGGDDADGDGGDGGAGGGGGGGGGGRKVRGPPQWPIVGGEVPLLAMGYGAGMLTGYSEEYHRRAAAAALAAMQELDRTATEHNLDGFEPRDGAAGSSAEGQTPGGSGGGGGAGPTGGEEEEQRGVQVVALLVTFNSTDALDKVLYELSSSSLLGQARALLLHLLRPPLAGTCAGRLIEAVLAPLLAYFGEPPKFEHAARRFSSMRTSGEPSAGGGGGDTTTTSIEDGEQTEATRLLVEPAVEPSDYIWENVSVSPYSRMKHKATGWAVMLLCIAAAVLLNVTVTRSFKDLPPAAGGFTHTDQKCLDVAYLRSEPDAAHHCGFHLPGGEGSANLAAAPSSLTSLPQACGAAGGCGYVRDLGRLVEDGQCTADTVSSFSSYGAWDRELRAAGSAGGFAVSDRLGNLLPECAFLAAPTADGRGFRVPTGAALLKGKAGDARRTRDAYCAYRMVPPPSPPATLQKKAYLHSPPGPSDATTTPAAAAAAADTPSGPFMMEADWRCRSAFGKAGQMLDAAATTAEYIALRRAFDAAPGLAPEAGLADVTHATACDDPNCILCVEAYHACQQAAAKVSTSDHAVTSRGLAAAVSGFVISLLNTALAYLAKHLAAIERPISQSHLARSIMEKTFLLYTGNTLLSLLLLNWASIGHLGFYLTAGTGVYSLLVSYGALQHGQSGRLGGAITGHHGLRRLRSKAWGCPPHSEEGAWRRRSPQEAMDLQPHPAQVVTFTASDHITGAIKLVTLWTLPPLYWLKNRFLTAPAALTQQRMNEALEGYAFNYATSTASILFLVFISVLFSTVLPLSLLICAASAGLRYLTERLYFLRVYKRPPRYDASLLRAATSYLPVAIAGKIATMLYFYNGTHAGETGVYVLLGITVVWLTLSSATMRALLLPCCLVYPVGPWKWVAEGEEVATNQAKDVAATVTHQTLKSRRHLGPDGAVVAGVDTYDPLGPPTPTTTTTTTKGRGGRRDTVARQRSSTVGGVSAFKPHTWSNGDVLPEAVRDPNSGEDAHLPRGAVTATHVSSAWGQCR